MIVKIQFTDGAHEISIVAKEVIPCVNGLEKLIVDNDLEIAFPVQRIKKITYNLNS